MDAPELLSGRELKALRERYGLTQSEVGVQMKVYRSRISGIEVHWRPSRELQDRYKAAIEAAYNAKKVAK
jgi:DNA-binding XRE family transcriptional regulator